MDWAAGEATHPAGALRFQKGVLQDFDLDLRCPLRFLARIRPSWFAGHQTPLAVRRGFVTNELGSPLYLEWDARIFNTVAGMHF